MKQHYLTLLLFITALSVQSLLAQNHGEKIDQLIKTYHEYGQFNGAVLVAENGKVILKKGYGMANMEWGIPIQPDTKFRIGSVTKTFTATLIMQFVEEGKVKLDAKLTEYLPDYRNDTGDKVTIHHLLNHTSGIPNYTNGKFSRENSRDPYTVDEFVKKFASGDLEFEPGSKYSYSNSGYFLLGAIIEKVTNKSYPQVLEERILKPLGMDDTGYDFYAPLLKNRASGYRKTFEGFENARYVDMSTPYAAGAIYSTVEDLYKWDRALYGTKILSEKSKSLMFKPGELSDYGYGFHITNLRIGKTDERTKAIYHDGSINGFDGILIRLVDQNHFIVLLDNVELGDYHGAIFRAIRNIIYDQPFDSPKKSIAETLYKTAKTKGGVAAVTEYRKLKTGVDSGIYNFSEGQLNTLGYQLLRMNKIKDAIEIFKLNVEMFPESSNTYDSLGETYLKDGQNDLALKNYKKAVELDPKNENAIKIINRLEGK